MKKTIKLLSLILALALFILPCGLFGSVFANAAQEDGEWVSSWATSPVNGAVSVTGLNLQDIIPSGSTIRTELTVTTAGTMLKFHFSNQYGTSAVTINEACVAKTDKSGAGKIVKGTSAAITFDGNRKVTIPAGKDVWSDAITYSTSAFDKLSVSLYFQNLTYITTTGLSNGNTYLATRSLLSDTESKVSSTSLGISTEINISSGSITYHTIPFLCDVNTLNDSYDASTVVFIGDSTLVNDAHLYFAQKIVNSGKTSLGFINESIVANKLLSNGTGLIGNLYGEAMVKRFTRDVLNKPNVKYVFVKIGLNDILHQFAKSMTNSVPHYTPEQIISGYQQLISICHEKNIKIYFFTKSAWKGYERNFLGQSGDLTWSQEAQDMCNRLNDWIKSNNEADGFIDCSPLADPTDADKLCSTLTLDGAHLSTLGAIALADLIPTEYVGVKNSGIKTAAQLNGVNPYAEKEDILSGKKSTTESTTKATQEPQTQAPVSEPTSDPVTEPATVAPTTQPADDEPTTAVPIYSPVTQESSTYAYIEPSSTAVYATTQLNGAENQNMNYQVQNIDLDTTQSNSSVFYIFILFSAVIIAATLIFLTIGKRKEIEY